jgi:DNA-binding NarL/FixJ family response regulator/class 3 adenylate cyclase
MTAPTQVPQDRAWLELPGGKLHSFKRECHIGRSSDSNDLTINERAVSSRHAIISSGSGGYTLVDQHSTNGTYLNGLLVQKPMRVKDGDEIRLAKIITLRFRCTRNEPAASTGELQKTTVVLQDFEERTCWLLLADVEGFSNLINRHGNEVALQRLQTWITEVRPLIENNGGTINRYVGDAIFACWPCSLNTSEVVLAAIRAIEDYRSRSPVPFRVVVHHGSVFFTRSEVGEELTGQEVNFLFRAEKIVKRLGARAALSQSAVHTLQLEGRCDSAGKSAVEGIDGYFTFFRVPRDFTGGGSGPGIAKRILLVEESSVTSDGFVRLLESERSLHVSARAQHGSSARKLHAKHQPDLVIIDLALRTGETLALISDLIEADSLTRILVFTGLSDLSYIERALRAGALGYMLKSDPTEQVLEAIRVVSEGGMYLSRKIAGAALRQIGGGHSGSTPRTGPSSLSDRELDVFRLIGLGQPNRNIAVALGISVKTVEAHRENIKVKLSLANSVELAATAKKWAESAGDRCVQ